MSIFDKRINYKPFEYPEVLKFTEAINQSFWVHSEVDFTADTQDFHSNLSHAERTAIKHSLLAIAQTEVEVNLFWGELYEHFPKPEFNGVGSTFAESEFRHAEAYSRLIEVLGYNAEFEKVMEIPVIRQRVEHLSNVLQHTESNDRKQYVFSLILFTILIENVSLFSLFAVILSFTRFKGYMKNISNIVAWTSIDEQVHANTGIAIVNIIRKEFPDFFDPLSIEYIRTTVRNSIEAESKILDWIFSEGEIETINKQDLLNFMKYRVDDNLKQIGFDVIFHTTEAQYQPMRWFEEEVFANSLDDFFAKRPTEYTKHDKSIVAADLF